MENLLNEKLIQYCPIIFNQAKRHDINNSHIYEDGKHRRYPSITTILNATKPQHDIDNIERWKALEGLENARKIFERSGRIGTAVHTKNENYMWGRCGKRGNGKISLTNFDEIAAAEHHHENFKPYIDKIDKLYGVEVRMHSERLNTAGTSDVIANYDGINSIIDYKNKRSIIRDEEHMRDYYLQATAYSLMFQECTAKPATINMKRMPGIEINQLVVLASIEGTSIVQEFITDRRKWYSMLHERLNQFDRKNFSLYSDEEIEKGENKQTRLPGFF